jgi:hypothetical protein
VPALSDPANILAFDLTGRTDGDYHPADTSSNTTSAVVADAVAAATGPLNDQITALNARVGSLVSAARRERRRRRCT